MKANEKNEREDQESERGRRNADSYIIAHRSDELSPNFGARKEFRARKMIDASDKYKAGIMKSYKLNYTPSQTLEDKMILLHLVSSNGSSERENSGK